MRILLLMDPFIPVPPKHYGGIERVIFDIGKRYVEMGHEVTLIAGPNSQSPGRLILYGENGDGYVKINYKLLAQLTQILVREIPKHDVLHNFGRLAFLFPVVWTRIRKIQTYMRYITPSNIRWLNRLKCRNITYTGVSDAIVKTGYCGGGEWKTVYNCAPIDQFKFVSAVPEDAPLCFLGRLERCKGAHTAITVAEKTGRKLIIAGNISNLSHEKEYFYKELQPRIDGKQVRYIGSVDNKEKNALLGSAAAMLLPIEWYEPFPVVLPESFACGTPILAFRNGGVPEGIEDGITGFLSNTAEEMTEHVNVISKLSRVACRKAAEEKYSDIIIANNYLHLYKN